VARAAKVAQELADLGVEVVLDDRKERAGVKFNDNDLMGFPYQVVCGKRGVKEGICELKERRSGDKRELPLEEAASVVAGLVKEARS
jgi:prolyl-tRNA synthetase